MNPAPKALWNLKTEASSGELLERLLLARGVTQPAEFFARSRIEKLPDPFLFEDMQKAVDRIKSAISNKERIVVYGDYDVDGTSGAALLLHLLNELGAKVSYRIPHRLTEGYGLHQHYVDELAQAGVRVLITVDCGISCRKEIESAQAQGIDVIITDHHTVPADLPPAYATLHPLTSSYPFKDLSGSGVAFKFATALLQAFDRAHEVHRFIDLALLGTIADCVPLHGENRDLVRLGLAQLAQTEWDGLRYLIEPHLRFSGPSGIKSSLIAFQVAPRLNAAGRMDHPHWALQTLLAKGSSAQEKVAQLDELNRLRQDRTQSMMLEVEAALNFEEPLLIACGVGWSRGLVGLVAGRVQEKYGKPCFILEESEEDLVGSARSLPGFHAVSALDSVSDLLLHYGGHEQAAGFHLKKSDWEAFSKRLQDYAKERIHQLPQSKHLHIDTEVLTQEWTPSHLQVLQALEPFGVGNTAPIFLLKEIQIESIRRVGKKQNHLKWTALFGDQLVSGIAFDFADREDEFRKAKQIVGRLSGMELELLDFK